MLGSNQLTEVPEFINGCRSLEFLSLNDNPLRVIPKFLLNINSLKELVIDSAQKRCLRHNMINQIASKGISIKVLDI
ncbi:MAG: hypothetical protein ACFFKA_21235 [Candidatus Thorarchaeota archaeon]